MNRSPGRHPTPGPWPADAGSVVVRLLLVVVVLVAVGVAAGVPLAERVWREGATLAGRVVEASRDGVERALDELPPSLRPGGEPGAPRAGHDSTYDRPMISTRQSS